MKARINNDSLPKLYKTAIIEYERKYRSAILERFILGFALTLSDLGWGQKRIERTYKMLVEIIGGYSDEAYGGDKNAEDIELMNNKMRDELMARNIEVYIK